MDPKKRLDVKVGLKVNIVLKADQRTGKLTQGVVKDILTKCVGTRNPHNAVRATLQGLQQLKNS